MEHTDRHAIKFFLYSKDWHGDGDDVLALRPVWLDVGDGQPRCAHHAAKKRSI